MAKELYPSLAAIAPAMYQRQVPDFETDYTPEGIQTGEALKDQTDTAEILSDLQAAIAYVQGLPPFSDQYLFRLRRGEKSSPFRAVRMSTSVKAGGVGLMAFSVINGPAITLIDAWEEVKILLRNEL